MSRILGIALTLALLAGPPLGCDLDNPSEDAAGTGVDSASPPDDTLEPPPEDTLEPPPEDTLEPPPEDTLEPPPEDTIVPPPEDTIGPPMDTFEPPEDVVEPPEDAVEPPADTVAPPEDIVTPPECVKEGAMGSSMMTPMECCEGLDMIAVASWDPAFPGMCGMATDVFLCAKCGNDHCEDEWENPCNCPEDCPFPGPTDAQALCAETGGSWTDCGSGCGPWACGEAYPEICPAVCIPQCACPAGDGWDPEKGCVTCSCGEWSETWGALLAQVQACQSPDDCIDVPGTSCGCTMNYVVNQSADLWMFWLLAENMGAAGCTPFVSTCSCPAVDGFKCENNTCGWNYL
jgi:hypothetical protein